MASHLRAVWGKRAGCCALLLMLGQAPSYGLSLRDSVSSWPCALESERQRIATYLVNLVGKGRQEMDEQFFETCMADLAFEPNMYELRIRDAANGCAYMSTLIFLESG